MADAGSRWARKNAGFLFLYKPSANRYNLSEARRYLPQKRSGQANVPPFFRVPSDVVGYP